MALLRRRGSDDEPELASAPSPVEQPILPPPAPAPAPVETILPPPVPAAETSSRFQPVEGAEEMLDMPLGTLIFRAGLIAPQQLEDALAEGLRTGKRLGEVLLARGWLSEEDLTRLLAGQKGLPFALPRDVVIDQELAHRLGYEDAKREMALPLIVEFGVPVVAMADPSEDAMDRVRLLMGEDVRFVVSPTTALAQAIDEVLGGVAASVVAAEAPLASPAAVPGLAPIASVEAPPAVVPLGAPLADPERLAAIAPQQFEEVTPIVQADEIDYPTFGQYQALPEAEILSGPSEYLPQESQGDTMMDYAQDAYPPAEQPFEAVAEAPEPAYDLAAAAPEPAYGGFDAPAPEAAPAQEWSGNGASEQSLDLDEVAGWAAAPVEAPLAEQPQQAAAPWADAGSSPEPMGAEWHLPESAAAEGGDELGAWPPAEPAGTSAQEALTDREDVLSGMPAWARGEVSSTAAELLAVSETGEEEAVVDEQAAGDAQLHSPEEPAIEAGWAEAPAEAPAEATEIPLDLPPEPPEPAQAGEGEAPRLEPMSEPPLEPSTEPSGGPGSEAEPPFEPKLPQAPEHERAAFGPGPQAPEPVPALEPEPAFEPAALEPEPEPPAAEPEPAFETAALEHEPAVVDAAGQPSGEPEVEETEQPNDSEADTSGSVYFEVVLRLADGERLSIDSLPSSEGAQERAQEVIAQVAAAEPGKWPFINGRFLRPDMILSVDIDAHRGWGGSGNRSRMFKGPES